MLPTLDDLMRSLRERGERLTVQRRMVLEILCEHGDHLAVQEIHQRLEQDGVDLTETTVYRILQWLKEVGVISQTDLGQTGAVYQLVGTHPHHHLVCLSCGAVLDVEDDVFALLRDTLRREYGFEPRIDHMAIFGLCRACQDAAHDAQ
jgi:Fur family ferric uptake transcriptional regulator